MLILMYLAINVFKKVTKPRGKGFLKKMCPQVKT